MKKYLIAPLVFLLAGCASQAPAVTPEQLAAQHEALMKQMQEQSEAMKPISCANKELCDIYWQRVRTWIESNSSWRIRTATDVVIQTYGPGAGETNLAYSSMRENQSDGSATITTQASCDTVFGCEPEPWKAIESLKKFVTK